MKKLLPKSIGGTLNLLTPIFPRFTRNIAFNLLSRIKRVAVSEEGLLFFSRGETHWLNIGGCRTALHRWGNGPKKVLFIHGWMSNSQRWREYVDALDPSEYTCFALDAPAHGASEGNYFNLEIYREAYEATLKITHGIDVLVSHSMGNLAAAYQFLYQPSVNVSSYVVLGSPSGIGIVYEYAKDILGLSENMIRNLKKKTDEVLKISHREIQMSNFFNKVDKPVLVIHEESDTVTPIAPIKEAVFGLDHIETLFTTEYDHTLKGPLVLEAITNFISEKTKKNTHVFERI
jgi:esterase/lipase